MAIKGKLFLAYKGAKNKCNSIAKYANFIFTMDDFSGWHFSNKEIFRTFNGIQR